MEYLIHPLLDEGRIREPKSRSVLRACKFARQPEESGAQFAQGQALPFFRETCPLKSRDQVVGQPNYFPIEGVGRESTSGNLSERIVLTQIDSHSCFRGQRPLFGSSSASLQLFYWFLKDMSPRKI